MMNSVWAGAVLAAMAVVCAQGADASEASFAKELNERLAGVAPTHPRLFFSEAEEAGLKARIESEPLFQAVNDYIQGTADVLLDIAPVERDQEGRRLLGVSRTCLQRVSYLAFAYRMTGNEAYLRRAEEEMLAAAGFEDWNPSHFLDVAEMTTALAIGYDWLYNDLSPDARDTIRDAIVEKGLETSINGGWWVRTTNNWNQVCHGGLVTGALAVLEDEPELARQIIARAIENLPRAMHEYEPDGVYPEGPSYWVYGTTYNLILLSALESVLGTDFGLGDAPGFRKTPEFYLHATGPTGLFFNFADCGARGGVTPAMYWFAAWQENPALLWNERRELARFAEEEPNAQGTGNRVLPFLLIWAQPFDETTPPSDLHYRGDGPSPVGMHRSGWNDEATYLGIKGGSPSTNHGHMDIGSFVLDMQGVRWAYDLGMQGYHGLESQGIGLWNRGQDSERWTVFRLNNFSHNTLVVDEQLQRVDGHAPIVGFSDASEAPFTLIDMAPVYEGQLAEALRGARLFGESVLIQDELRVAEDTASVRWGMVTRAEVTIVSDTEAVLEENGRTVTLRVLAPERARLEIYETENPPRDYDARNPGTRMIGFTCKVSGSAVDTLAVFLQPGETPDQVPVLMPLEDW